MLRSENSYSNFVSLAKIVMPIVGLGMLSSLFLINRTPDQSTAIPYSDVELNEILHGQRLSEPKYRGTLEDQSEVMVDAERAQPDPQNDAIINAQIVRGTITQTTGAVITLTAPNGLFDQSLQVAKAMNGAVVTHSDGYTLTSDTLLAQIDRLDFQTVSDVVIVGPDIRIEAGRMHLRNQGVPKSELADFTQGVKVVYTPPTRAEK